MPPSRKIYPICENGCSLFCLSWLIEIAFAYCVWNCLLPLQLYQLHFPNLFVHWYCRNERSVTRVIKLYGYFVCSLCIPFIEYFGILHVIFLGNFALEPQTLNHMFSTTAFNFFSICLLILYHMFKIPWREWPTLKILRDIWLV